MRVRITLVILLLSLAFNVAFASMWARHALSDRPEGGRTLEAEPLGQVAETAGGCKGPLWCALHTRLAISDEQWGRIEPRLAEFYAASQALRQGNTRLRTELVDLLAAPDIDMAAVEAKRQDILKTQAAMEELVIDHLLAERQVLSVEQQRELFSMIRECACKDCGRDCGPYRGLTRD